MKVKINDKKCGANENTCTAIKVCPVGAINYIKVDEAITDKEVKCDSSSGCGCGCGDDSTDCGADPFGRIVIDHDKCTGCGLCVEKCCGKAIEYTDTADCRSDKCGSQSCEPTKGCSNVNACPCPEMNCKFRGKCCECVSYHLRQGDKDFLPTCFFPCNDGDKSKENFYRKLKECIGDKN